MTPSAPVRRYAVIGNPVEHSRSPFIHEAFARQTGIALSYGRLPAPLDGFEAAVADFFAQPGAGGLNVTVPFKEAAWRLVGDALSPRARLAGAVNTLWMRDGVLQGCNTDGVGLCDDLARLGHAPSGRRVLLIGAGGAARGVLAPLLDAGAVALRVVNRSPARAQALVDALAQARPDLAPRLGAGGLDQAAGDWQLAINATSTGLNDQAPELPAGLFAPGALAYDMVYAARPTAFMRWALADGAGQAEDGLGMLVAQAAASFMIWHGRMPDAAPVLAALRAQLRAA